MLEKLKASVRGGASVEYALFLCIMAVMIVSGVAMLGDQFKPLIVAWRENVKPAEIDYVTTASPRKNNEELVTDIQQDDGTKTYRIYKLPEGLR